MMIRDNYWKDDRKVFHDYMNIDNYKKISHGDYLIYEIPDDWIVEENDDTTSIFRRDGVGSITISYYNVFDIEKPLDEHICIMASKFIDTNKIKLKDSIILNPINKNKLSLYCIGKTDDDWFIKLWIVAKYPKIVLTTYQSKKKTSEIKTADEIINSFQFLI